MRRVGRAARVVVLGLLAAAGAGAQVVILQSLGVDPAVDYRSLTRYGPWDDRNYRLTKEDLALLPEWEAELQEPLPAFFRVEMRRARPELAAARLPYPRSALQIFQREYGGYLIDGRLYNRVDFEGGEYRVLLEGGVEGPETGGPSRALDGEVRVTSPVGAAESAVAISPTNPNRVIAGSNGPGSGQRMHYSTDGGETWTQAAALPLGGTCCDPTVDWSSDGRFAYTATLGGTGRGLDVWFYRSADGGQTWNDLEILTPGDPRREITTAGVSDKEYLHVDRHAGSPHRDNLYLTWHDGNRMKFSRSTDFGNTWSAPLAFSDAAASRGIGSDIVTDRAGRIYYAWPAFNSRKILVRKSASGGAGFGPEIEVATTEGSFIFAVPSMESRKVFIYVTAAADLGTGPYADSVYLAWTDSTAPADWTTPAADAHARIRFAYSRDAGATWTVTTPHETADAETVDRWHPWLAVGGDGVVHLVFYDTRRSLPGRDKVDLFHVRSEDGGQTFSAPARLTALQSPNILDSFEFGDYNGLDVTISRMVGVFTDNRQEGAGAGDSVDVYAAGLVACPVMTHLAITSEFIDTTQERVACNSITAGSEAEGDLVVVEDPGALTLRTGKRIVLLERVEVRSGATLSLALDPQLIAE